MKVLYGNQIKSGVTTITPSSENSNFTFSTAFYDPRLSRFGQFLGKTSENIVFYNSTGFDFDEVLIADSNLTSSATVTIQANATDVWTSPTVSQALTRLDNGYYYYNFSSTQSYDYVRLVVADSTNTESYIKISKVFVGDGFTLPGIDPKADLYLEDNSVVTESLTGQAFSDERTQMMQNRFSFPDIIESERQNLLTWYGVVGKHTFFYLFIWENDLEKMPPIYSRNLSNLNIKKITSKRYSVELEFRQVK